VELWVRCAAKARLLTLAPRAFAQILHMESASSDGPAVSLSARNAVLQRAVLSTSAMLAGSTAVAVSRGTRRGDGAVCSLSIDRA
jgi:hypothetical protein